MHSKDLAAKVRSRGHSSQPTLLLPPRAPSCPLSSCAHYTACVFMAESSALVCLQWPLWCTCHVYLHNENSWKCAFECVCVCVCLYVCNTRAHLSAYCVWLCYRDAASPSDMVELQRSSGRPCKCQSVGTAEHRALRPKELKLLYHLSRSATSRHPRGFTRAERGWEVKIRQRKTQERPLKPAVMLVWSVD